jgi:hypothetical protein
MFSTLQQMFNLVKEEDMHGSFCVMGFMFGNGHVRTILEFKIKLFGHYYFFFLSTNPKNKLDFGN